MRRTTTRRSVVAPPLGKWDNSVGFRLPKHVVETSGLSLADPTTIHAAVGRIVLERRRRRPALVFSARTLAELTQLSLVAPSPLPFVAGPRRSSFPQDCR